MNYQQVPQFILFNLLNGKRKETITEKNYNEIFTVYNN